MKVFFGTTCLLLVAIAVYQTSNDKGIAKQNRAPDVDQTSQTTSSQQEAGSPAPKANFPGQKAQILKSGPPVKNGQTNHPVDDVEVQRQLAKFTKYLAYVGLLQAVVLAATLWFIRRQAAIMGDHATHLKDLAKAATDNAAAASKNADFSKANADATKDLAIAAKENAEITRKTLVLQQRPRIAVRVFYFSEIRGVGGVYRNFCGIEAGSTASGQFYIVNVGGTKARIREIVCRVFIDKDLPMKRPYEGEVGSQEEKIFQPGQSAPYIFALTQPLDATTYADIMEFKTKRFYVLGWIGYVDDLEIYRVTGFCRAYDPIRNRLVPVTDPDYEYAD